MTHYGDITKIRGYDMEAVDVITGGSPCQDLSVAGKRSGFGGERSVLFLDQVRIVKEMRERDRRNGISANELVRPRYMVWENVPGAFSSRNGEDFKAVLEETVRIAEPEAPDVPVPEKGWPNAGLLYDEMGGWSVAWRVHDAKLWGVPQRRRRVALVADFAGLSAGDILFEREGLRRYSPEGERARSFAARRDCDGAGAENRGRRSTGFIGNAGAKAGSTGCRPEESPTLSTSNNGAVVEKRCYDTHPADSGVSEQSEVAGTVSARYGTGGGNAPIVLCDQGGQRMDVMEGEVATLRAEAHHPPIAVQQKAYGIRGNVIGRRPENGGRGIESEETSPTLTAVDRHAVVSTSKAERHAHAFYDEAGALVATDYKDPPIMYEPRKTEYVARRLTPMECERLMGFPDFWTDIGEWTDSKGRARKSTDAMRYKALGNSIALPYWKVLARRICAQYDRDATMGSLFDGIGGFPLAFMHCGAECLWTCEIEEFPKAVVKFHFGGEDA